MTPTWPSRPASRSTRRSAGPSWTYGAGTITATPPEFRPIGLDGQTVVGLRSTGGLSVVAEGIDIATGQPRWTGNVRVEDPYAAVVTAGLAHFVEDGLHNSSSLLVNTADGTVRAKLPDSE